MDNIERFANGEAAFASLQVPAWHRLGTVFEDVMSTDEILQTAHMADWNVRLIPAVQAHGDLLLEVPEKFTVIRTNPVTGSVDALSVVGTKYTAVQNEQVFGFGQTILDNSPDAVWETAGSIRNGRTIFGTLRMSGLDIMVGGEDVVDCYLVVTSSHDGSTGVSAIVTPIRVVCKNTLAMAMGSAKASFKARHTASIDGRIDDAQEALGITYKFMEEFEATATKLADTKVDLSQLEQIVETIWAKDPKWDDIGADERRTGLTRWENRLETIGSIYVGKGERGDTMSTITGTGWGALNAVTEYTDWYGRVTGRDERAAGFNSANESLKAKALDAVLAVTA
jgi:phage/plasmid-like protein (TIGR03299 family)